MRLAKALVLAAVFAAAGSASVSAALLEEHVTGGSLDLTWVPGFDTPNNMYGKTLLPGDPAYANPSGDHTVAVAQNAHPDSGGIIATLANPDPASSDYTWEAWIFTGGGETRRGLVVRATPDNDFASMYQFVIQAGLFRLSFRKLVDSAPTTLADWFATALPAGSIPQNTWHKMKIIAVGNQFRCFFDDFELTASPIVDGTIPSGWVGCYNFRFDLGNVPVYFDDLVLSCPNEVPVALDLEPNTLNLKSLGKWVKGVLEPEAPASASDIDVASIRLNGTVAVDPDAPVDLGDADGDGIPDLSVRFLRSAVDLALDEGDAVPVKVTGLLAGDCFSGTTTLRVVRPRVLTPGAGDVLSGGSSARVTWETSTGAVAPTVALLWSGDDGASWQLGATGLPNTGTADWTVPVVQTDRARLAVVQIESADASGYVVQGVLSVSEAFRIVSPLGVGTGERPVGLVLRAVANPSRGPLRVSFSAPDQGLAELSLYDVLGRRLESREVAISGAGLQTVTLIEEAPAGVYVVRLTQASRSVSVRLTVTR